jgi:cellulose synthase/poly-beta-1,6-N-acetylglucosamine synthase-like glycosyltransferase
VDAAALDFGVSFVVPVYNKRPFLPIVTEGLKGQTGDFPREYIFIDDGSSDGSAALLAELTADWRDVRILQQPNAGPSVATNRAIAAARYSFIKFVDGDDALLPGATAALLALLRQHPEASVAFGRTRLYRSAADIGAMSELTLEAATWMVDDPLQMLLRQTDLGPTNCLVRTHAVRTVGGCDERVFTQDYSLLLRLATMGPFAATERMVAACPASADGRVNDGGPQVLHDCNLTLFHFITEHGLPARLVGLASRRAATRAWLWARRRERAGPLSFWLLLRGLMHLPFARLRLALLRRSCDAFTLSRPVRRTVRG